MAQERAKLNLLRDGPAKADCTIILAHGAGAGMDTEFMTTMAQAFAAGGFRVVRFEFPYMVERRRTGTRKPPNRIPVLCESWLAVIKQVRARRLVIGGKSMGGRVASMIADQSPAAGLVCLGYPFHPAKKPDQLRTEHLKTLDTPALIVQGERDALGSRVEVEQLDLPKTIQLRWLPDGDHSFMPRKSSGHTQQENWSQAIDAVVEFVAGLSFRP